MQHLVPAVVIRGELNGLGIVRSLARERVPTIIADTTRRRAAMWSRYCQTIVLDKLYGRSFIDSLLNLGARLGVRPVLILTDEMAVRTVSEHRDEIRHAYRFHLPPHHMVATLDNKARFQELAERHGLPVPRTIVVSEERHLEELSKLQFPAVVKPADRHLIYFSKAERLHQISTLREANVLCGRLLETEGEHVVQELIEGPDSNICFTLFHCGREAHHTDIFTGRKLACYPPMIGSTAICRAAHEVRDELVPLTMKFLELTDYRGLGSLEFKWDQAHGRFVIIEPTVGRSDWQEEIATLNGVNLPLAAYRCELGLPPIGDVKISHSVVWKELYFRKRSGSLSSSVRVVDGYWRANDPIPAIFYYTYQMLKKIYRRMVVWVDISRWRGLMQTHNASLRAPNNLSGRALNLQITSPKKRNAKKHSRMATIETMIVGAGPYGLSIASHLRAAKSDVRIIGRALESWRQHMPAGMILKSEAFACNFSDPQQQYTLENFRSERGAVFHRSGVPVPLSDFLDYADWFIQRTKPNVEDKMLQWLRRTGDRFELVMTDGEVATAERVILATGHLAFRQVPPVLNNLPNALVSHSADHHNFTKFDNCEVTVIGGGQSSLEIAALLHEQGTKVRVLVRKPIVDWNRPLPTHPTLLWRIRHPEAGLGPGYRCLLYSEYPQLFSLLPADRRMRTYISAAGPSGAWWLKDRVVGKFPVLPSHEVIMAVEKNGKLQLSVQTRDGVTQFVTDHVIVGTGYKIDLERLSFIDTTLRSEIKSYSGAPILNSVYESSVPNLHFVGLPSAPSFGPILRFVHGTKHPASVLTRQFRRRAA